MCWLSGLQKQFLPVSLTSPLLVSPLVCSKHNSPPSPVKCDASSFISILSKARVYPNQLSFKLTQKIHVSLGREPLQKARPEDYCSPVSETGEKECQHSKALTKTVRKPSWLRRHVASVVNKSHCPSETGQPSRSSMGLPLTSLGPDLATWLQLVNAWRNFANLYLLKGPSTNSVAFFLLPCLSTKNNFCSQGGH